MRYAHIHRHRRLYPLRLMCRLSGVSSSGYYAWLGRPESQHARDDRALLKAVRRAHVASDGTYGSPRITSELRSEGLRHGRSRVARIMREARLTGCPKRRFRVGSKPSSTAPPNLLKQDFSAAGSNQRWVSDITYIWTAQGWLYLAVVMDLYSRRIVGWSMNKRVTRQVTVDALDMAVGQRQLEGELIHHSDRGAQYLSDDYQQLLARHGIICSMNGRGRCYDNAAVESFFATLKRERTRRRQYSTRDDARADVFDYIERFYNRQRRHSYLGYISPVDFENRTAVA